jgi:hypothetical protein
MNAQPLFTEVPKPRLPWNHYLALALFACALPWLAVFTEMLLTWSVQIHLAGHFGTPISDDPNLWLWMIIPGAITFVLLLPFSRSPKRRWIASACLFLAWTLFFLSGQADTK